MLMKALLVVLELLLNVVGLVLGLLDLLLKVLRLSHVIVPELLEDGVGCHEWVSGLLMRVLVLLLRSDWYQLSLLRVVSGWRRRGDADHIVTRHVHHVGKVREFDGSTEVHQWCRDVDYRLVSIPEDDIAVDRAFDAFWIEMERLLVTSATNVYVPLCGSWRAVEGVTGGGDAGFSVLLNSSSPVSYTNVRHRNSGAIDCIYN